MSLLATAVSVRIGGATLLREVSVAVSPGEVLAVAGPNGAGKSTLIALLSGDRTPDAGAVTLAGRAIAGWPRAELARRRAVMGAERDVAFAYTAEDVVQLGRLPVHGGAASQADVDIVRGLLAAVDCLGLAQRRWATLSTGERQRVALARAVAQLDGVEAGVASGGSAALSASAPAEERYLLLDEPTSSLDPAHQHLAMQLLRQRACAGIGVLAVVHDLDLAAAYADRLVLLRGGQVAALGTPAEVLQPDLLEQVFDIPMLVLPHPARGYPLVIPDPRPAP
jgi:iron complex transport system ATP-binding protein